MSTFLSSEWIDVLVVFVARQWVGEVQDALSLRQRLHLPRKTSLLHLIIFMGTCQATFLLSTWINDEPYLYRRQRDNKTVGVSMTLLQLLANKLNFSYTMTTRSVDGLWGTEENGEWNGLLEARTVIQVDEFSTALLSQDLGTSSMAFILTSGCFVLQAKVGGRGWNADMGPLRAILGQSSPYLTEPRLFAGLWLLICFVLTAAYTSNLVGVFTKPAFPPRLTTLSQLLNSEKRLTVLDQGNIMMEIMKNSVNPSIRRFSGRLDFYVDDRQVVAAMAAGTHGYVASITYTSLVLLTKFKASETQFQLNDKNELGALGYTAEERSHEERVDGGTKGVGRPGSPLTMSHLQGLFSLLGLAWALSTLIFLLEIIHKKKF
ncbi:hypothetical protein Pcinc_002598 [Petrolisthes cinctipes]|uniref:Ionotropic glutamate receptor L-glutamate and glycine-binding domain-containing protein n=1 Tax=Petrolisthes cinctipes TaxID=88211 RepID=A0AAE1GHW2_PETCI|nr:hypothetical protein Pcinc_002598 [Petrolisthes cinctipes]